MLFFQLYKLTQSNMNLRICLNQQNKKYTINIWTLRKKYIRKCQSKHGKKRETPTANVFDSAYQTTWYSGVTREFM